MKLSSLEASFISYQVTEEMVTRLRGQARVRTVEKVAAWDTVDKIDDANGVIFLCPKCFAFNKGKVGTHRIICWSRSRGVPDSVDPKPGRWALSGTGIHDLTLEAEKGNDSRRSVALLGGCGWHGYVTAGETSDG